MKSIQRLKDITTKLSECNFPVYYFCTRSSYRHLRSNVFHSHAKKRRRRRPPRETMPLMESPPGIRRGYASLSSTTSSFSLLTNVVNITACLDRMISSQPSTPIHNSYGLYAISMPLITIPFVHLHWIFCLRNR